MKSSANDLLAHAASRTQAEIDFGSPQPDWSAPPVTVSQLNAMARGLLEQQLPLLWVAGEISNLSRAASGHCYFSLKDDRAQVRCVMFKSRMQYLDWTPANGMQVEVRAAPTLYEARGEFQLTIDYMRRAGLGALFEAFAKLKARLDAEGLFAADRKRPLPAHPRRIGIITSPAAAALRDVLTTLRRRMPGAAVVLYPTAVQGNAAAIGIAAAIASAGRRRECDVLILCRGGGSIEDLWPFNEEIVARALADCALPVVCGVGHETDFTIADFVADARAPTPTAAAQLAVPDRTELAARVKALKTRLKRVGNHALEREMQRVDWLATRVRHPGRRIADQQRHLGHLHARLARCLARHVEQCSFKTVRLRHRLQTAATDPAALQTYLLALTRRLAAASQAAGQQRSSTLARLHAQLGALNPRLVLERGYAMVQREDGAIVRDAAQVNTGDALNVSLAVGGVQVTVSRRRE